MGWIQSLMGGDGIAKPIEAFGSVANALFTSDDERLNRAEVMARIEQAPLSWQNELNKLNAQSTIPIVQFARPFCVYIAGINFFLLGIAIVWCGKIDIPEWYISSTTDGFLGALGIYGLMRTIEKVVKK